MSFWRRKTEQRTIPDGGPVWPDNGWAPSAFASTPERALAIGDVWTCVRCLSDAAASVPLSPYRRQDEGRMRLNSGRLAGLLDRPAPAVTQANLVATMVSHLVLWGNAYLGKFRDSEGRLDQLAMLHPDRVQVELVAGTPVYTVTDLKGHQSKHGTGDIVHVKAMSTDGLLGLSPVKECKLALASARGMAEFNESFFRHGGRPSGIIKVPSGTGSGPDPLGELATSAAERYGGARNAHRIAVVSGDVEWQAISGPLDDLQFVEQRHLSTAEIARIFRVPVWMIGGTTGDSMTYSNVENQQLAFVTHSLRPWLVVIEQAISNDVDLCPGNLYVEFLLDALLRADSKTRAEVYTAALDPITGWMRRDEVRRLENLEPEGVDSLRLPEMSSTNGEGALIA